MFTCRRRKYRLFIPIRVVWHLNRTFPALEHLQLIHYVNLDIQPVLRWEHGSVTFRTSRKLFQTDQPTERPTDRPTNQPINRRTERGLPRKVALQIIIISLLHYFFTPAFKSSSQPLDLKLMIVFMGSPPLQIGDIIKDLHCFPRLLFTI